MQSQVDFYCYTHNNIKLKYKLLQKCEWYHHASGPSPKSRTQCLYGHNQCPRCKPFIYLIVDLCSLADNTMRANYGLIMAWLTITIMSLKFNFSSLSETYTCKTMYSPPVWDHRIQYHGVCPLIHMPGNAPPLSQYGYPSTCKPNNWISPGRQTGDTAAFLMGESQIFSSWRQLVLWTIISASW